MQINHGLTKASPIAFSPPVSRIGRLLNSVLVTGICALLAFGPLALGAVQPWSICVLEVATALLILIWGVRELANGAFHISPNPLYIPMALFAGVVLVQIALHLSAYWYATWSKGLLWASYAGLLFLVAQVLSKTSRISIFGFFCVGYGFLLALFAIVQQFTSNGKIYWVISNRHGGWIYGPYVNHAHYAGLMEMLIPFPVILAIVVEQENLGGPFFFLRLLSCVAQSSSRNLWAA